jgi:CheY-like chemotaxis protein
MTSSAKDDHHSGEGHGRLRRPWHEGPAAQAAHGSLLSHDDDELLQTISTIEANEDADARLLEVVQSDRHFFVRQEAAKRIRNKKLLFPYEDDRHVGQILVRHLTRREDLTYLERLVARSQFTEVRTAAQVQLARLRKKLTRTPSSDGFPANLASETWRIAVLHNDAEIRRMIAESLPPPEFEVSGYEPGLESTQHIATFDPHLVLADVSDALVNPQLHETIRAQSRYVPLVVLCPPDMTAPLVDVLGRGADEFILLPIQPNLLMAKTRALVHFAHRSSSKSERHHLSGAVGPNGILQLFRLCEEHRLTCRLVVTAHDQRRWVDFLDGEMIEAGGSPPVPDEEALATLLAIRSGTYEIAERRFDEIDEISADIVTVPRRLARLMPDPAAVALLQNAVPERDAVDASLFGWAVHFIVEQAWMHLGTTVTAGLLRRTQQELLERHPLLAVFQIEDNAHVNVDLSRGARLPHGAVVAVALWMADFLDQARRIVTEVDQIKVRQTTALMADALDQVGFYAAYEVATNHLESLKV